MFISSLERFLLDQLNKQKNVLSKAIGEKMKKKEPQGDNDAVSDDIVDKLASLVIEDLRVIFLILFLYDNILAPYRCTD